MGKSMPGIQPHTLSDEELLRHIYMMGYDKVPENWVRELAERFMHMLDDNK